MVPLPEPLSWLWSRWVVATTLTTLFLAERLFPDYEWGGGS